jgi:integrase/recombinase XerD
MPYQYKREPLTPDEANRLASACETHQERFIVWTLLDTGLRVSELAGLTREHIDWQNHRLMIYGKGGIYGTKSKRRIVPLTDRIRPLIDGHFAIHDTICMTLDVSCYGPTLNGGAVDFGWLADISGKGCQGLYSP